MRAKITLLAVAGALASTGAAVDIMYWDVLKLAWRLNDTAPWASALIAAGANASGTMGLIATAAAILAMTAQNRGMDGEPSGEKRKGLLIVFEGATASGKTTQATRLARNLENRGWTTVEAREPGGTETAEEIRTITTDQRELTPVTRLMLFEAARAELMADVIKPALDAGHAVILDRYTASTVAYQGWGDGLDLDTIARLNRMTTGGTTPDLTVWIRTGAKAREERLARRGPRNNRYDAMSEEYYDRVNAGYESQRKDRETGKWLTLDGEEGPDQIEGRIWQEVKRLTR